jgi:hypothetical protein
MPNLAEQIRVALTMFAEHGTEPALIGGLAVTAHQVVRATLDLAELREYFALFNQLELLDELLA